MRVAIRSGLEARVGGPFRMTHHLRALVEQAVVARGDADRMIGGVEGLVRHQRRARAAEALRLVAAEMIVVERAADPAHRRFEQRGVDHAALAGAVALLQRGEDADHRPHAGGDVVDRRRAEGRRIFRPAGQRHHRAVGLRQRIEARRIAHRPLVAERADRAIDQPRIDRLHRRRPDAHLLDDAGPQVLDQDVGIAREPLQLLDVGGVLDVDRDRTLVAVGRVKHHRGVVDERRAPHPRVVAAVRLLDLDDVGADVGQDRAGQRTRQRLSDLDHLDARERSGHGVLP